MAPYLILDHAHDSTILDQCEIHDDLEDAIDSHFSWAVSQVLLEPPDMDELADMIQTVTEAANRQFTLTPNAPQAVFGYGYESTLPRVFHIIQLQ